MARRPTSSTVTVCLKAMDRQVLLVRTVGCTNRLYHAAYVSSWGSLLPRKFFICTLHIFSDRDSCEAQVCRPVDLEAAAGGILLRRAAGPHHRRRSRRSGGGRRARRHLSSLLHQPNPSTRSSDGRVDRRGVAPRRSADHDLFCRWCHPGPAGSAAFSQRTIYGAAPSTPSVSPVETWGARTLRKYEELRQARPTVPGPQTALILQVEQRGVKRQLPEARDALRQSRAGIALPRPAVSLRPPGGRSVLLPLLARQGRGPTRQRPLFGRRLKLCSSPQPWQSPYLRRSEKRRKLLPPPVKEEREVPAPAVEEETAPIPQIEARPKPRPARLFRPRLARVPPPLGDDGEVDWFHIDRVITREEITAAVGRATYNFTCHQGKVRVVYSRDPWHPPSLALLGVPQKDILPLRLYTRASLEVDLAWWDPRISEGQLRRREVTMTALEQALRDRHL